tara:strand:- start:239 stop:457 length:219 start_codon:yes stop_codon:yes gene_type:complete
MFKAYVPAKISIQAMDALLNNNYIQDYTDDGTVYNRGSWMPVGDVLEYLILSEDVNEEKTEGQEDQVRSSTS